MNDSLNFQNIGVTSEKFRGKGNDFISTWEVNLSISLEQVQTSNSVIVWGNMTLYRHGIVTMIVRLLTALLFVSLPVSAQETLTLTFSDRPSGPVKTYSTRSQEQPPVLSVMSGRTVTLQQNSGTDFQLQGGEYNWAWTQVQQVPRNATALVLTPVLSEDGESVVLEVNVSRKQGDDLIAYTSTVNGSVDEWLPLLQSNAKQVSGNTSANQSWSAGKGIKELWVRIQRLQ